MERPKFDIRELLAHSNEEAVLLDGFDEAIVGVSHSFGKDSVVAYSIAEIIKIMIERDGMTYEDAMEFFEFNILGAHFSDHNPVFIESLYL